MRTGESKRWHHWLIGFVLVGGLAWLNAAALLTEYALWFRVDNPTPGADAIVILGPRHTPRVDKAFELVEAGYSSQLLLTELPSVPWEYGVLRDDPTLWTVLYGEVRSSFPEVSLVRNFQGGVLSTWDEAWDIRRHCEAHKFKHIIIVTNGFHTRRSLYAFEKVFKGTGIKVEVAAASNGSWDETFWWKTENGLQAYVTEPAKFLVYLFTDHNVSFLQND